MVGAISPRRQFSDQVIAQLRDLFSEAGGEHVAGRLWRDVLNEEERAYLGGDFGAAFRKDHHAAIMYHRLNPSISFERALLETARQVGWLFEAKFERLLSEIGEPISVFPRRGTRLDWDGKHLTFNTALVREIKQPRKAFRVVEILDNFQRQGWPPKVTFGRLGVTESRRLREAVASLNDGLTQLVFRMDGTGMGVIWSTA